jgi:hypothetical protein
MTRPHDPGLVAAIYLSSPGLLSSCSADQFVQTVQIVQAVQIVGGRLGLVQRSTDQTFNAGKPFSRMIEIFLNFAPWRLCGRSSESIL